MKSRFSLVGLFCGCVWAAFALEVRLTVEEPGGVARAAWPVTSGVPFAQSALRDPVAINLHASDGKAVPVQADVLARWPDGSVRWLLLDFQIDLTAGRPVRLEIMFVDQPACGSTVESNDLRVRADVTSDGLAELSFTPDHGGTLRLVCTPSGLVLRTGHAADK